MKAIVVEDEMNVREGFVKLLNTFCPDVTIVGLADSVQSGLEALTKTSCDILFLDINLPDGSGFDLIRKLDQYNFNLIFVTAYNQYAIDAFKISAVDYLMKPVAPDELINAVEKVKNLRQDFDRTVLLDVLKETLEQAPNSNSKIILTDSQSMHVIQVKDILYCEAQGSYTKFYLSNSKQLLVSQHLKEYENLLRPFQFIRPHHSYLVNINHIHELNSVDGHTLIMSNETQLPISVRKKAQIIETMRNTFINPSK